MMFNSKFVIFTLLGQGVSWVTQTRAVPKTTARTGARRSSRTAARRSSAIVWGVSLFILSPAFFLWLSPVVVPLVFSIPISILLEQGELWAAAARKLGLFLTPEETYPPYELKRLQQNLAECYRHLPPIEPLRADYGLLQAVLDPYVNAMHVALLRQRRRPKRRASGFPNCGERLLREGPAKFTTKEKMALLLDAESMIWLHRELLDVSRRTTGGVVAAGDAPIQCADRGADDGAVSLKWIRNPGAQLPGLERFK